MSKTKAAFAIFIGGAIPVAFGVLFTALVVAFAHQHVHDRTAKILNDHQAIVHVSDFHHSTAGIVAVAAIVSIVWLVIAGLLVLAGGSMYSARDRSWE